MSTWTETLAERKARAEAIALRRALMRLRLSALSPHLPAPTASQQEHHRKQAVLILRNHVAFWELPH